MKKFITIILSLVMLFSMAVLTTGCANEPEEVVVPVATEEPTPESETDQEEQSSYEEDQVDPDLDNHLQPTPPPPPTEEEAERFRESLNLLDLPFEIPPNESIHGIPSMISDITSIHPNDKYFEFHIFLMSLIEGHWRLTVLPEEIEAEAPDFQWHEYLFTNDIGITPPERADVPMFGVVYRMSRFDRITGEEYTGVFGGTTLLEPDYNRIEFRVFIYLDDHDNLIDPRATATESITWHFYLDNPNVAVGFFNFGERDPVTDEIIRFFPMGYTRIG